MSLPVCGVHPEACHGCEHLEHCGGMDDEARIRDCGDSCGHFDGLNQCCWQAGNWGLFLDVAEGDSCHFGYMGEEG